MKLPALWIFSAFAAGVEIASLRAEPVRMWALVAAISIVLAAVILWRGRVSEAFALSFVAWGALGGLAASVEHATFPRIMFRD